MHAMKTTPRGITLSIFALLLLGTLRLATDDALTLEVTVNGLVPQQGQVIVSLFDEEKQFLKQPFRRLIKIVSDSDSLSVRFDGLQPGEYAANHPGNNPVVHFRPSIRISCERLPSAAAVAGSYSRA
jgi:uncharacterized protein (DUF2141 family)